MLKIDVKKEKNLEVAIKKLKRKVIRTKQMVTIRDKKAFKKPSTKRREVIKKAIYRQKFIDKQLD